MISNNIYTNYEGSNQTWLQAYTFALSSATAEEKAKERREDYSHPSQTYADYLDYKEEWHYATGEMIDDVKKSYIYRMAKNKTRMQCNCGKIHILTLYSESLRDTVQVDDPYASPWSACWYKTVSSEFSVIKNLIEEGALDFPNTIARNLTEIVRWKLAKSGRTPTLLPYETYKEVWWNIDINGGDTDLSVHIMSLMRSQSARILKEREQSVRKPTVERYFFTTEEVINDHGFHIFMNTQQKIQGDILKYMNRLRRQVGHYAKALKGKDLEKAQNHCTKCQKIDVEMHLSPFGIYCAPPGAGKTTAQHKGLLIGFDTDWIGIGPTWRDYSFLMRRGIPIITNQVNLFRDSGVKIQLAVSKEIRRDAKGRQMANYDEVCFIAKEFPDTYVLHKIEEGKYLSDYVLRMTALAHIVEVQMSLFINTKSIWEASDAERQFLNEFGKKMRNLAEGKVKVYEMEMT